MWLKLKSKVLNKSMLINMNHVGNITIGEDNQTYIFFNYFGDGGRKHHFIIVEESLEDIHEKMESSILN